MTTAQIDTAWGQPAERIFAPEYPDRQTRFTVDRSSHHFRLWFNGFGRYLLDADGTTVGCERGVVSRDRQERFLFAQVLPLAAALQGYGLLHASAICGREGVAAFVGGSGAGKTSLASRLVVRGAGFVTDDVLTLEPRHDAPFVLPGPPFMAVPNRDRWLIDRAAGRLGAAVGTSDKVHASPRPIGQRLPLRVLYYLEPAQGCEIIALDGGDAQRILSSGFAPYLLTPARLHRHLEIAQLVGSSVDQFRLQMPRTGLSDIILETLEAHLRERAI